MSNSAHHVAGVSVDGEKEDAEKLLLTKIGTVKSHTLTQIRLLVVTSLVQSLPSLVARACVNICVTDISIDGGKEEEDKFSLAKFGTVDSQILTQR